MTQPPPRSRRVPWWIATLGALALGAGITLYAGTGLERELRGLPADERAALYRRTLESLRTSCVQSAGPELGDYCREQADFVTRFPECDRECHELAERFTPQPSR